ncbi:OLC1v1021690C1 [Oldenlandia corymbosa var. corymbosa]|uniref:OLC1v1021690C1 n=1 Tax=Oldenlandia corymbosa var. corymbosa TaxID=529605 RepID=A0AAV1BYP4_OLDCO|nr:OLC1v1021690C1 [Oldenlandia corymbosa var. corymbosa]
MWLMSTRIFLKGDYPESMRKYVKKEHLPEMGADKQIIQGTCDFIESRVMEDGEEIPIGRDRGGSAWLTAYPKGMEHLLLHLKQNNNNPLIYITENGIDDHDDNCGRLWSSYVDHKRISYIHDHLSYLLEAKRTAVDRGVVHFAVNGVTEDDWHVVKEMSDRYPSVVPNFGIHPWFVAERTPNWLRNLKEFFDATPEASVGEIGLDKGSRGRQIDFSDQVEVFRQQLQLAKELKRPASIHCVRAFGDLFDILKSEGPFPAGVLLHSYLGSAELVPEFAKLGAYFSFSGFLMSMKESKAKKMLKSVPLDRILLETDAPDALPRAFTDDQLLSIEAGDNPGDENSGPGEVSTSKGGNSSDSQSLETSHKSEVQQEILNHPANIHHVLAYVASLLEMTKEELAESSYQNAVRIFSYHGSKRYG